jgi:hypothetical protein
VHIQCGAYALDTKRVKRGMSSDVRGTRYIHLGALFYDVLVSQTMRMGSKGGMSRE